MHAGDPAPTPPVLIEWLKESGLWARGVSLTFRQLMRIDDPAPVVLLLDDGGAALVVGRDRQTQMLMLRDPHGQADDPAVAVDELRLKQLWSGAVLLVRATRASGEEEPVFNLAMLARLVWMDWRNLRDIAIASVTLTMLSVIPIVMVMQTVSVVIQYHSLNTLALVAVLLVICVGFEMLLHLGTKAAADDDGGQARCAAQSDDFRPVAVIADRILRARTGGRSLL